MAYGSGTEAFCRLKSQRQCLQHCRCQRRLQSGQNCQLRAILALRSNRLDVSSMLRAGKKRRIGTCLLRKRMLWQGCDGTSKRSSTKGSDSSCVTASLETDLCSPLLASTKVVAIMESTYASQQTNIALLKNRFELLMLATRLPSSLHYNMFLLYGYSTFAALFA